MSAIYTVYANIEAYDESKVNTSQDDCWHPSEEVVFAEFDTLEEAETLIAKLQMIVESLENCPDKDKDND